MGVVQGSIAAEDRLRWLTDRLGADGAVTVADAVAALGVSEMTIRRDLDELEERGVARRVRGGARAIGPESFAARHQRAAREKSTVAAKAAPLVLATGVLALDASSTVMRVANGIGHARDLTVLTNGLDTFTALQATAGVTPLLTGGALEPRTGSLVGPLAVRTVEQLSVDVFLTSAAAVDVRTGTTEASVAEAEVKRAMAVAARTVVLCIDSTKLDARGVAVAIAWDDVDVLVTDLDPDDARIAHLRELVDRVI